MSWIGSTLLGISRQSDRVPTCCNPAWPFIFTNNCGFIAANQDPGCCRSDRCVPRPVDGHGPMRQRRIAGTEAPIVLHVEVDIAIVMLRVLFRSARFRSVLPVCAGAAGALFIESSQTSWAVLSTAHY